MIQYSVFYWATSSQWTLMNKLFGRLCFLTKMAYAWFTFVSFYKIFSLLHFKFSRTKQHLAVPPQANISIYYPNRCFFIFVKTSFMWNSIPHDILSLAKVEPFMEGSENLSFQLAVLVLCLFLHNVSYIVIYAHCICFREAPKQRLSLLVRPCHLWPIRYMVNKYKKKFVILESIVIII